MIGNPVNYDKKYKGEFPIHPAKLDWDLKRYLKLIPGKEVLDLGIGQGRNSIPLVELGYNVTGVDYSTKCLEICKNNGLEQFLNDKTLIVKLSSIELQAKINYLTSSLNFLPAENAGTVLAAIFKVAPV